MTWAFLVPLLGGAVHLWAWGIARGRSVSPALARPWQNLLFAGLATVTAGLYTGASWTSPEWTAAGNTGSSRAAGR